MRRLVWLGLGALCWSLWTVRNKMLFEKKFAKQPIDVLYKLIFFLQQWKPLWKGLDHQLLEHMVEKIKCQASKLKQGGIRCVS